MSVATAAVSDHEIHIKFEDQEKINNFARYNNKLLEIKVCSSHHTLQLTSHNPQSSLILISSWSLKLTNIKLQEDMKLKAKEMQNLSDATQDVEELELTEESFPFQLGN